MSSIENKQYESCRRCCDEVKYSIFRFHMKCNKRGPSEKIRGHDINSFFGTECLKIHTHYCVCYNVSYKMKDYVPPPLPYKRKRLDQQIVQTGERSSKRLKCIDAIAP